MMDHKCSEHIKKEQTNKSQYRNNKLPKEMARTYGKSA
jgi:hypothetical protein